MFLVDECGDGFRDSIAKCNRMLVKLHRRRDPPQVLLRGAWGGNRGEMLWTQLAHLDKITSKGVYITVNYYKEDNNTMYATITICEIEQQKAASTCVKVDVKWDVQSPVSSPVVP